MTDTVAQVGQQSGELGVIDELVSYARENLSVDQRDVDWTRNRLLEYFSEHSESLSELAQSGDISGAALNDDAVMSILSAPPSRVEELFAIMREERGSTAAMQWLFDYCVANGYVKKRQLDRNIRYVSNGLIVTINTAKPEFKTMRNAASGNAVDSSFAQCTICRENEGLAARGKRTLRTVDVALAGDSFFWQFSPYGYFRQHGICVNQEHTPMHVDRRTFEHLLAFVQQFPEYFLGCNAALPRIGGSVLAHDHYQGGGELMPMQSAPAWKSFALPSEPDVRVEIIGWPATALRVLSADTDALVRVCERIRTAWADYDNDSLDIHSHDEQGERQSSVAPIARILPADRAGEPPLYEMSLILRNNAVSEQYPLGVFHAHPEYFFIKQEPIGLIEAMGLFVLPGRLVSQLDALERALADGTALPEQISDFELAWNEVRAQLSGNESADGVRRIVRDEVGSICRRILGNIAVFPQFADTERFLRDLGCRSLQQSV